MDQQQERKIQEAVMQVLVGNSCVGNRVNLSYISENVAYRLTREEECDPEAYVRINNYAADWIREQSKEGKLALIRGKGGGVCVPTENETHLACTGCGEKRWFATSTLKSEPYLCSTCKPPVYESRLYGDVVSDYTTYTAPKDPESMTREEIEAEIARLSARVERIKASRENHAIIDEVMKSKIPYEELVKLASQEKATAVPIQAETVEVINDLTCSSCGNTKCSSTEKSCWKCGAGLHG